MNIRLGQKKDMEQVRALSEKYNLNLPGDGVLMVAENEGKIWGYTILRPLVMIEPFVSESITASKRLYEVIHQMLEIENAHILRCNIKKENKNLLSKLGFTQVFENLIQMEKII